MSSTAIARSEKPPKDEATAASLPDWAVRRLLTWFARCRRDLPWRRDRDPYRIWISEVMLQQTQVATVIPYFERFLGAFPSIADLAKATEQEVLRLWEGLGYYRRARDLHRTAQRVSADLGGIFPDDPRIARTLPGLGRYTCNAVLSQAFDSRLPIVEANTQRVLSRLFARSADPKSGAGNRWLWQAAEAILPARKIGAFNQALMELGSLVCTPTKPKCAECPLAEVCQARAAGLQEVLPVRALAVAPTRVRESAVVVRRAGKVLLVQRPAKGQWATLWEFPHGPIRSDESDEAAAERMVAELTGLKIRLGKPLLTVRHGITRYAITLTCFEATWKKGTVRSPFYTQAKWLPIAELSEYPFSAPQRRVAKALANGQKSLNRK